MVTHLNRLIICAVSSSCKCVDRTGASLTEYYGVYIKHVKVPSWLRWIPGCVVEAHSPGFDFQRAQPLKIPWLYKNWCLYKSDCCQTLYIILESLFCAWLWMMPFVFHKIIIFKILRNWWSTIRHNIKSCSMTFILQGHIDWRLQPLNLESLIHWDKQSKKLQN